MRKLLDKELDDLSKSLIQMAADTEMQLEKAIEALERRDHASAKQIIKADQYIDDKEKEIEHACLNIILTQQPVAKDLRMISACLKIITDLERIADHAEDIAEISIYLGDKKLDKEITVIRQIFEKLKVMLRLSIDTYTRADIESAYKVCTLDDEIDRMYSESVKEAIKGIIEMPSSAEKWVDLIQIAKYLERVGDHAENIAEWVIFAISGTHPRDHKDKGK